MRAYLKPTSEIITGLKIEEGGEVHKYFTHTCRVHMDKYVPMDEGNLAISNVIEKTDEIIYASPYAHYMYEGRVMGPNIPIKNEAGLVTGWFSPKGKPKHYTGADIKYNTSKHSYAGKHWDKRMWSAEKDEITKKVQEKVDGGK